jgi:hypothetical protein
VWIGTGAWRASSCKEVGSGGIRESLWYGNGLGVCGGTDGRTWKGGRGQ